MNNDNLNPTGRFTATHICKDKSGKVVSLSEALSKETIEMLKGKVRVANVKRNNLVVNQGRKKTAELLGGRNQRLINPIPANYIDRLILGDGPKAGNYPNLNNSLATFQEITKTDVNNTPFGTFLFDNGEIFYPDSAGRVPVGTTEGWAPTLAVITDSQYLDVDEDTFALVQPYDQVTLNSDLTNPLRLTVLEVVNDRRLRIHNPSGYLTDGVQYRIDTPGTQVLFSKLVTGNTFHPDEFGPAVIVKEAGLLFNDSMLFNRVVFAPENEDSGVILQSDQSTSGIEISVRFEFVITI